jgi:hypothetical protein
MQTFNGRPFILVYILGFFPPKMGITYDLENMQNTQLGGSSVVPVYCMVLFLAHSDLAAIFSQMRMPLPIADNWSCPHSVAWGYHAVVTGSLMYFTATSSMYPAPCLPVTGVALLADAVERFVDILLPTFYNVLRI